MTHFFTFHEHFCGSTEVARRVSVTADGVTCSDCLHRMRRVVVSRAMDAIARHIAEQRADDENAPICIHVAEAYEVLGREEEIWPRIIDLANHH